MAIQRNLRLDTEYTILSSWYSDLIDGGGASCDNCGRIIANCCEIQNTEGQKFTVGMDCASTLSGIKDTLLLSWTESSFQQAKSARSKVIRFQKQYPEGSVSIVTFAEPVGYYKEVGAGKLSCSYYPPQGQPYFTMKQYPAEVWLNYVFPMIKNLAPAN